MHTPSTSAIWAKYKYLRLAMDSPAKASLKYVEMRRNLDASVGDNGGADARNWMDGIGLDVDRFKFLTSSSLRFESL